MKWRHYLFQLLLKKPSQVFVERNGESRLSCLEWKNRIGIAMIPILIVSVWFILLSQDMLRPGGMDVLGVSNMSQEMLRPGMDVLGAPGISQEMLQPRMGTMGSSNQGLSNVSVSGPSATPEIMNVKELDLNFQLNRCSSTGERQSNIGPSGEILFAPEDEIISWFDNELQAMPSLVKMRSSFSIFLLLPFALENFDTNNRTLIRFFVQKVFRWVYSIIIIHWVRRVNNLVMYGSFFFHERHSIDMCETSISIKSEIFEVL